MRTKLTALAGAALLVAATMAATAAPALGWHVSTGDCESAATAWASDPGGDPFLRVVVRNDRSCFGWVGVPDNAWAEGTVFHVGHRTAGRGERIYLRPGSYTGTWSNSSEVEHFTIRDTAGTVRIGWSGVRRNGRHTRVVDVPAGCTWRSPWVWHLGGTKMWVQDRTHSERLLTKRVAPPGFYGGLWRGYTKGLSCPVSLA